MHQDKYPPQTYTRENIGLRTLLLAFFAPVDFNEGKFAVNHAMMLEYAATYMKRNLGAAILSFATGEFLYVQEYALPAALLSGMFILFSGLCSISLAALLEKNRKTKANSE